MKLAPRLISEGLNRREVLDKFRTTRQLSEKICAPLATEDYVIQSMPDVSPPKWHLAHTSWFFETFILVPKAKNYKPFDSQFAYLFNSYYKGLGEHYPRTQRGFISRPTTEEVYQYRHHVDKHINQCITSLSEKDWNEVNSLLQLGIHHEQQHQELLLTDILHIFSSNPLKPVYLKKITEPTSSSALPLQWISFSEGLREIGHQGDDFSFDNERPRHRVFLENFRLASRLVTNGEFLEFINDKAYSNPLFWLSDAWDTVLQNHWEAPLYWEKMDGTWKSMTLLGMQAIDPHQPVCHVSFYEADAFARWAGKRLATEAEWEWATQGLPLQGNFLESGHLRPMPTNSHTDGAHQFFGDVWEWTASPYTAYPGFKPETGAVGEYNGKFMCNQMILRGGSCVTSASHLRPTYRNFFPPAARWQFSGFRLAEDL